MTFVGSHIEKTRNENTGHFIFNLNFDRTSQIVYLFLLEINFIMLENS